MIVVRFRRQKVIQTAVHPRGSDCHGDYPGIEKYLCYGKSQETGSPPTRSKQERTVLSGSNIWCRFEFNQHFWFQEKSQTYHSG
jgi:hypothetical protein